MNSCFRYRSILDAILTSSGDDLTETLKVFIEASMTYTYIKFVELEKNHLLSIPFINDYDISYEKTNFLFSCK
jgi:hypothetical protein